LILDAAKLTLDPVLAQAALEAGGIASTAYNEIGRAHV